MLSLLVGGDDGDSDNDDESSGGVSRTRSVGGECNVYNYVYYNTIPSFGEGLRQSIVFPTVSCICPLVSGS